MSSKKVTDVADQVIEQLQKALGVPTPQRNRSVKGMPGWSQDSSTGHMHHSTLGTISTFKAPEGGFNVRHEGKSVGTFPDINSAGAGVRNHMNALNAGAPRLAPSPKAMGKAEAGAAPKVISTTKLIKPEHVKDGPGGSIAVSRPDPSAKISMNAQHKVKMQKSWASHAPVPEVDQEYLKKAELQTGEEAAAQRLGEMMQGRGLFGPPPPKQPTDQEMFGHLVSSDEELQKKESEWGNTMNNWFAEANKPISKRFASEQEEIAYWDSLKIADRDDGQSGFQPDIIVR